VLRDPLLCVLQRDCSACVLVRRDREPCGGNPFRSPRRLPPHRWRRRAPVPDAQAQNERAQDAWARDVWPRDVRPREVLAPCGLFPPDLPPPEPLSRDRELLDRSQCCSFFLAASARDDAHLES